MKKSSFKKDNKKSSFKKITKLKLLNINKNKHVNTTYLQKTHTDTHTKKGESSFNVGVYSRK